MSAFGNNQINNKYFNFMNPKVNPNYDNKSKQEELEYVKNQSKIITEQNKNIPDNYRPNYEKLQAPIPGLYGVRFPPTENPSKSENYEPMGDFLFQKGLLNRDNTYRYVTEYLNIDSSQRNKIPKIKSENNRTTNLIQDPLVFIRGSNRLLILDNNINPTTNDKISITGITQQTKLLNMINNADPILTFTDGSEYATINYFHMMSFNYLMFDRILDVEAKNYDQYRFSYIQSYDTSDLYIELAGIKGFPSSNFINNIPISTLNGKHRIYLLNPEQIGNRKNIKINNTVNNRLSDYYSDKKFYIKLVKKYKEDTRYVPITNYSFQITYYYYAGIPINRINSSYPTNLEQLQGYLNVSEPSNNIDNYLVNFPGKFINNNVYDSITNKIIQSDQVIMDLYNNFVTKNGNTSNFNGFIITLPKICTGVYFDSKDGIDLIINPDTRTDCTIFIKNVGGSEIIIRKFDNLEIAYPSPNNYIIPLEKTYNNVVMFKMVSSEFPISDYIIKKYPTSKQNNKLYWQILEDGETVYSIEILPGNYTPDSLIKEIEYKISQVPRINGLNNEIKINIDTFTNLVAFSCFKTIITAQPLKSYVLDNINVTITINHNDHNLNVGDTIIISHSLDFYNIPANYINTTHIISEVIDSNFYKIIIKNINFLNIDLNTYVETKYGGNNVNIKNYINFRLDFSYTDTCGVILGFRNCGNSSSVTKYNYIVKNNDAYESELTKDAFGNDIVIKNNFLKFDNDDYILIVSKQISGIYNNGKIKEAFAKIILKKQRDGRAINTFVNTPIYLNEPIPNLNELEFNFYSKDGELYEFNDLDHSFTLEITSLKEIPIGTGISSKTGKIN
jgi:hypothetical protein